MNEKDSPKPETPPNEADLKPSDTVSYETHRRLLDQRKADQARAAAAEAERDRLKAAAEEAERKRLEEAQAYKDLYEKERLAKEELAKKDQERTAADIARAKRDALRAELGGAVKDEYLQFADMGAVVLDPDGKADPATVKAVAAKFRQEHPSLIGKPASQLPSGAPRSSSPPQEKPLKQMSFAELAAAFTRKKSQGK